jgi:hypothetical protein
VTRAAADALMAIFGLRPVDPDAQALADRLVADNQPRATTKRRLARRKRP